MNLSPEPPTFARWLKQLRAAQDVTQEQLSELVGCATPTLRSFEIGARRPSREMAERIADVLKVPTDQREAFVRLARQPVEVKQTVHTPLPHTQPPSTPLLPPAILPLIGREAERNALLDLLLDERSRLVTIVGAGGMGKTRLALDLTANLHAHFPDGAGFVALAAVNQVAHLPSALAGSLNIPLQGVADPQQQVNAWLAPRRMLLTLDNFEQLLPHSEIVTWVLQLLTAAPQLHLLVTSRERLRVSGERVFELTGLNLPATHLPVDQADAALLFLDRAQQADSGFAIDSTNRAAIGRICHLLAGMPLAIELAAAWVNTLTPGEIADEISRSIDFLGRAARDVAPRHRSIRAVFDHSWSLLSDEERAVLMKLSVFAGGCTRQAAQAVAGATLPVLAGLIDKSLLRKSQSTPTRYTLHELVRQYTYQKLSETSEALLVTVQQNHLQAMIGLADAHTSDLGKATHQAAVARLTEDHDNVRRALQWAISQQHNDEGLQLAQACSAYWRLTGQSREGLQWFSQLFAQRHSLPESALLARSFFHVMELAWHIGDRESVDRYYVTGLRLAQQHGDRLTEADLYEAMASLAATEEEMRSLAEQSLALYRQLGQAGESGVAAASEHLARFASAVGDHARAIQLYSQCLAYFNGHGDLMRSADVMRKMAKTHFRQAHYEESARLYQEALHIYQTIGDAQGVYLVQTQLGDIPLLHGNVSEAEAHYRAGLAGAWQFEDKYVLAWSFDNLARTALAQGQAERATQLFAAADTHFQAVGGWLRHADHAGREALIAQARQQVGDQHFARLWESGSRMTTRQAYEVALAPV